MRRINNVDKLNLKKESQIPFNEFSSLYGALKNNYTKIVKALLKYRI
jgi:hypothetical protein